MHKQIWYPSFFRLLQVVIDYWLARNELNENSSRRSKPVDYTKQQGSHHLVYWRPWWEGVLFSTCDISDISSKLTTRVARLNIIASERQHNLCAHIQASLSLFPWKRSIYINTPTVLSCWWIRSSYKLYNTNEVICKESSRYKSEIYQRFPTPNLVDREHCVVWIRVELLDSNKFRSAFWFSFRCILLPFLQRITNEDSSPTLHRASSVIGNSLVVHVATRALFSKQLAVTNMRPSSNTSSSANRTASQEPAKVFSKKPPKSKKNNLTI